MRSALHPAASLLAAFLWASLMLVPAVTRAAAQLAVHPLLLTLPASKLSTALTLTNKSRQPVTIEAELLAWAQVDGKDDYQPTEALAASPPIVRIAPGASQIIRIGRARKLAAPEHELAYRVRLIEVPASIGSGTAVTTVLNIRLPIFVPPASAAQRPVPQLSAEWLPDAQGLRLRVRNEAVVHGKVTAWQLKAANGTVLGQPLNIYVLPDSSREFLLPWTDLAAAGEGAAELQLTFDRRGGSASLPVQIARPVAH